MADDRELSQIHRLDKRREMRCQSLQSVEAIARCGTGPVSRQVWCDEVEACALVPMKCFIERKRRVAEPVYEQHGWPTLI